MLKTLLLIAAGYGVLVVYTYLTQSQMLYLPNMPGRTLTASPGDIDLAYEDISVETSDGVQLHGWFIPGRSPQVLLFFHGNAGNISHRLDSILQFSGLGLSVFIIDYRGYGQSDGRTTEKGLYRDAEAAWRYLTETRGTNPDEIVIFGRSMGGSVAAWLAARQNPQALIVESAFTSVPDIAQELYPWLPVRWLSHLKHATRDYVRKVTCPVLVVHAREDEIIPFHHGQNIFEAAPEPRMLLEIHGMHNDAYIRDERIYLNGVQKFLTGMRNRG